jgi:uncharacterized cupredoxin-like copper-binding protein
VAHSYTPYLAVVLVVVLYAAFAAGAVSMLVFRLQPPLKTNVDLSSPNVTFVLYAGEISDNKMGFGYSADNLTSPGPTLNIKFSDVVNVTVINAGKMPHAFQVSTQPQTSAPVLFNAQAGSATNPIPPGGQATTVFTPNYVSSVFYYICPISGHAEAGMWGSVIVTS